MIPIIRMENKERLTVRNPKAFGKMPDRTVGSQPTVAHHMRNKTAFLPNKLVKRLRFDAPALQELKSLNWESIVLIHNAKTVGGSNTTMADDLLTFTEQEKLPLLWRRFDSHHAQLHGSGPEPRRITGLRIALNLHLGARLNKQQVTSALDKRALASTRLQITRALELIKSTPDRDATHVKLFAQLGL